MTVANPPDVSRDAGTTAVSVVGLTYVVESVVPFHFTRDPGLPFGDVSFWPRLNRVPETVSVSWPPPIGAELGESDETAGAGGGPYWNTHPAQSPRERCCRCPICDWYCV